MNRLTITRVGKGYMTHERCGGWGCVGCGGEGVVNLRRGWRQAGVEYSLRCSAADAGLDLDVDRETVEALGPVVDDAAAAGLVAARLPRGGEWLGVMLRERGTV